MKLKQLPEDFFVEELTDVQGGAVGEFSLYRLEKRGWTTPDAVQAVRRRWKIDWRRISYGGLKDRHAHTIQYLTIRRGPQRRLTHQNIHLEYLGKVAHPFTSTDLRANRFRLAIRALDEVDIERAKEALEEVRADGVPNYFDDQRFGGVPAIQPIQFVGKALALGDFEQALHLALTAPYEHDRAAQKKEKAILRSQWGDWAGCQAALKKDSARALIQHLLHHPGDFRGAVAKLHPELRGLHLSAFQSHLWNRMLARWLQLHLRPEQLLEINLRLGPTPMYRQLEPSQRAGLAALCLPLPTARGQVDTADPSIVLMQAVLEEEGLTRDQLQVKGLREAFFSRGHRAALCLPADLRYEAAADELNARQGKLLLAFELPRGSYATLIVKRVCFPFDNRRSAANLLD
jgi:tRNA pseudouridine13 synthase